MACQSIIANRPIMLFLDIIMLAIPPALDRLYDTRLERQGVAAEQRPQLQEVAALLLGLLSQVPR